MLFLSRLFLFLAFIFSFSLYTQNIRINEVVASNSSYLDEDGDTPDWIELYNYGNTPISLNNWNITDDENDNDPWIFPNLILDPDEYLVLWASAKDRSNINYARTLINQGDQFRYVTPNVNLPSNWNNLIYNDDSWDIGNSGFGYSDSDDQTIVPAGTISIFLRKEFYIQDIDLIQSLILDIDYDDGFVAYLNGYEIARANINGLHHHLMELQ